MNQSINRLISSSKYYKLLLGATPGGTTANRCILDMMGLVFHWGGWLYAGTQWTGCTWSG